MPLLQILLVLIVVGVLLWLVNNFIPMAGSIKSILNAVVVIVTVLWLLKIFGLFHSLSRMRVWTETALKQAHPKWLRRSHSAQCSEVTIASDAESGGARIYRNGGTTYETIRSTGHSGVAFAARQYCERF